MSTVRFVFSVACILWGCLWLIATMRSRIGDLAADKIEGRPKNQRWAHRKRHTRGLHYQGRQPH